MSVLRYRFTTRHVEARWIRTAGADILRSVEVFHAAIETVHAPSVRSLRRGVFAVASIERLHYVFEIEVSDCVAVDAARTPDRQTFRPTAGDLKVVRAHRADYVARGKGARTIIASRARACDGLPRVIARHAIAEGLVLRLARIRYGPLARRFEFKAGVAADGRSPRSIASWQDILRILVELILFARGNLLFGTASARLFEDEAAATERVKALFASQREAVVVNELRALDLFGRGILDGGHLREVARQRPRGIDETRVTWRERAPAAVTRRVRAAAAATGRPK